MLEITPNLQDNSTVPYYLQLYQYIREEIHTGRFAPGTRLPSVRESAKHLQLSRNTIESAYQQLLAEGYLHSKPRQGLFISQLDHEFSHRDTVHPPVTLHSQNTSDSILVNFRNGDVDLNHFPLSTWRRLTVRSLSMDVRDLGLYGDLQGDRALRQEIVNYLHQSRGVNCSPSQIVIGAGIQYLLGMLCQLLDQEFDSIAMEDPGYHGAKAVFRNYRYTFHPIPLEKDGLNLAKLSESPARLAYITPSHQFPCGMVLPIAKRLKLLQWAEAVNGFIIEDDYDGEFRYYQKPIPAMQGLDRADRVIYLGTFSKSLLPSIRMGYMILPVQLLELFHQRFASYEQPVSRLNQRTLQLFMQEGFWGRHIRKMRVLYQKKQTAFVNAVHQFMGPDVQLIGTDAGLHILLQMDNGLSEQELIARAETVQVRVYPTSQLWLNPPAPLPSTILMGYGGLSEAQICDGLQRLANVWFGQY